MWWVPLITAAASWYDSKEKARKAGRAQPGMTQADAAAGVIGRVEGAKAAGLHPLAGLGTTVGSSSVPVGDSFNASGIDQAALAYREMKMRDEEREFQREQEAKDRQRQDALDKLTGEAAKRDAEEAALRNELIRTQILAQQKAMQDSDRDFAASQAYLARKEPSVPILKRPPPQWITATDDKGKPVKIPNPDLYSLELPEAYGASTLVVPEVQNSTWFRDAWGEIKRYFNSSGKEYFADPRNPQGLPKPVGP